MVFFSSRRRHTRWTGDWSSDVCSSDLTLLEAKAATGDIDGPAYWTAVVGQQELGLSRDQLYRSRSEERRVGKECISRWSTDAYNKKEKCTPDTITRRNQYDLRTCSTLV